MDVFLVLLVFLEATGMYGPAHNLDRGTCPGTNGYTLTVKKSTTHAHISHSNTQPHVATDLFCTCCGLICHNGHYKIPDTLL